MVRRLRYKISSSNHGRHRKLLDLQIHRHRHTILIVIDALDEIDGEGGAEFLRALFDVLNESKLRGLKFFATSRLDPDLVNRVNAFERKALYRLQDVGREQAWYDIKTYLMAELPHLVGRAELEDSWGWQMAYSSMRRLSQGIWQDMSRRSKRRSWIGLFRSVAALDRDNRRRIPRCWMNLYLQILDDAFGNTHDEVIRHRRLQILHTFLSTAERTSEALVATLLSTSNDHRSYMQGAAVVLKALHAVLYIEGGRVLSYHKSFSDFLFSQTRSQKFWCDQEAHHRLLTDSCFRLMTSQLKFNIANIPSSFILDRDNATLQREIERTISPALAYSCRYWSYHMCAASWVDPAQLVKTLKEFLQIRALFWIEVMNLLQCLGQCDGMLRAATNLFREVGIISAMFISILTRLIQIDTRLASHCTEAANFAVYFSGSSAAMSTPHLYISALATWPRSLDPCQGWKVVFPRIPAFTSAMRRSDSVLLMNLKARDAVSAIAISSDGTRIASCSNRFIQLWDASTGESSRCSRDIPIRFTQSHFQPTVAVSFLALSDKSVRVWDASTGETLKVLKGHTDSVWSVAFSTDGGRIVSGSDDKSVRVWDASTGETLKVLKGHTDSV